MLDEGSAVLGDGRRRLTLVAAAEVLPRDQEVDAVEPLLPQRRRLWQAETGLNRADLDEVTKSPPQVVDVAAAARPAQNRAVSLHDALAERDDLIREGGAGIPLRGFTDRTTELDGDPGAAGFLQPPQGIQRRTDDL